MQAIARTLFSRALQTTGFLLSAVLAVACGDEISSASAASERVGLSVQGLSVAGRESSEHDDPIPDSEAEGGAYMNLKGDTPNGGAYMN